MARIPFKKLEGGFRMPAIGAGTFGMGGRFEHDLENDDQADIAALQKAIDLGITHIDTAEIYANGYAEILVGQAIKKYERNKLFIASKVAPDHFSFDGVLESCRKSLSRLETNYLDLYLLHWLEDEASLEGAIRGLDELVSQGKVKNIGVSNFGVRILKRAQELSKNKIVCNQVHYNLIVREPEKKILLEFCQKNDVLLSAYRPVELGRLAGEPPDIIKGLSGKYKKTPAQIALNWLISQKNVVAIFKARDIKHLEENIGAVGWELDKEDIETLRDNYPGQKNVSDVSELAD
jgi:diketogulonate reductase-like aldo/keto reductase